MRPSSNRQQQGQDVRYGSQRQSQQSGFGSPDPRQQRQSQQMDSRQQNQDPYRQSQQYVDPRQQRQSQQQMDPRQSRQQMAPQASGRQQYQQAPQQYQNQQRAAEPRPSRQMSRPQTASPSMRRSQESHSAPPPRPSRSASRRGNSPGGGLLAGLFGRNKRNDTPPPQQQHQEHQPSYNQDQYAHQADQQARPSSGGGMFSKFKSIMSFAPQRGRHTDEHTADAPSTPLSPDQQQAGPPGYPGSHDSYAEQADAAAPVSHPSFNNQQQQPSVAIVQEPQQTVLLSGPPQQTQPAGLVVLQPTSRPGSESQQLRDLQHQVQIQSAELQELAVCKQRLLMESRALDDARRKTLYLDFKLNLMVEMMVVRVLELEGRQPAARSGGAAVIVTTTATQQQQQPMRRPGFSAAAEVSEIVHRVVGGGQSYNRREVEPEMIESLDD